MTATETRSLEPASASRPAYRIPSMREIRATPRNGLRVVSTFSGCGGSCLGFEMAGYSIEWANEFVPAAAAVYRLNHPGVPLDERSIRDVDEIPVAGEVDVLEGSPPCASFSSSGRVEAHWGAVRKYSDTTQRTDDLFGEYVRILRLVRPRVFVAENVAGLIRGKSIGHFKRIHASMVESGYRVEARVVDAVWLGVPQDRKRVIFVGVRDDLDRAPAFPKPLPYRYVLGDAIENMTDAERDASGFESLVGFSTEPLWRSMRPGEEHEKHFNMKRTSMRKACPTVTTLVAPAYCVTHPYEPRSFTVGEAKRICGFPDDFDLGPRGDLGPRDWYAKRYERLGRAVPPPMMRAIAETIRDEILA